MRVCRIYGAEDLRVENVPEPVPGRGEVLLKLGAGGICGSDLHYFLHGRIGSFIIREPLIPGHEISGTVAGVGSGVTRVKEGDTVAINPSHACGTCKACRAGRENLCSSMRFLGSASVFPHVQGMFREYFVMGERQCYPIAAAVTAGELAFAEPLSVALHAVNRAGSVLGKSVLVTGSGPIGCLIVVAARLAGATHITVTDVVDRPLETAKALGADRCIRADRLPDGAGALAEAAGEPDIAFEVSGSPAALAACLATTVRGGRIVQVATLPAEGVKLLANQIMAREIDYVGTFRFGVEFEWAIRYLTDRRVDVKPLLSAQYPLEEAEAAFRLASDKSRSIKVQVVAA
ncbi:MAG: L-idonate 5-dehydrogenase [Zetaproteobacteria bacterium]|nr:MAG: L-idonate 5-dehydrogenase [Zetaproteobacteria bacterium]